jgi:hypothetical protein
MCLCRIRITGVAPGEHDFMQVTVENMVEEPYDPKYGRLPLSPGIVPEHSTARHSSSSPSPVRDSMLKATQQALIESMREIMQNNRTINEQIMFQLSVCGKRAPPGPA